MKIQLDTIQLAGKQRFEDIVAFHSSDDGSVFFQESRVPFFLMLMSVKAGSPEKTCFSVYTPQSQILVPSGTYISGRNRNSQHQHNCFEFTYVLEGDMYQLVEGKRYFYPSGSCCLMNRNTLHTEELSTDYTCVFLSFSPDFVSMMMKENRPLLFPDEEIVYSNLIFDFFRHNLETKEGSTKDFLDFIPKISRTEQVILVHQIFEELLQVLIMPGCGASFQLLALLQRFIGLLGDDKYYNGEHVTAQSNIDSLLFSRINRILNEQHGRITNSELSELLNYNGSYLGRIVKKYTGKSLFNYSMTFTMNYAAKQLLLTEKTTTQIAEELRFTNLTHFYKLFREYYGQTPKEYRWKGAHRDQKNESA